MDPTTMDRRGFLRTGAALGGGLLVGFFWPEQARAAGPAPADPAAEFAPNAWLRVATDGTVTVIINKAEMGQGVCTSLAMLVAEELDADFGRVRFEFAPVDPVYAHPGFGIQMTGGSTSTAAMSEPLRKAGAAARAMLVAAAARAWQVQPAACRTENGAVIHDESRRRTGYGELVDAAAKGEAPKDVALKAPKDFRLIGKSQRRLDTPDKVRGKAQFAIDVNLPGMLTALVAHPPVFGAKVKSVKDDAARAVPGVKKVVTLGTGVAVLATGFWPARRARELLEIEWDLGPHAELSSDTLRQEYRRLAGTPGLVARRDGEPGAANGRVITADYELPYLAHATMEPLNCVVDLGPDKCEIWAGTQFQTVDHAAAVRVSGLKPEQVKLHTTFLGGGFGRRANPVSDYLVEAVEIAKAAAAPVKLVWTREDDMRSGYYRPMWQSRVQAVLDTETSIASWHHTIVGQSILAGTPFEAFMVKDGIDHTSVEGAADMPYAIPSVQVDLHTTKVGVPTLWWRSVGHSHTAFVVESFLDELAHAMGVDPFALRRRLLKDKPRHLKVLEQAARAAAWGESLPAGRARGIALHYSFNTYVAQVAEVSCTDGKPRVHKVTCAVDCGRVVNPDTVKAQMEGGIGFALSTALYGAITLKDGRVQQGNFHDYRMLRMHEMPAVDVHIIPSEEPSTGVGEPGVPPLIPAVCNALFSLTSRRIRRLPIRAEDLRP